MAVTLAPHCLAPIIGEWCTVCRRFTEHANGSIKMARPLDLITVTLADPGTMDVCATQCLYCAWVQLYR